MQFSPFPSPPVGLRIAQPHDLPIGTRALVLPVDVFDPTTPPYTAYVNSYTKATVRLNSVERKNYSYPDSSVYFKSEERGVYEALEGAERWIGYVRAYIRGRNVLRKLFMVSGDEYLVEALAASDGRFIPPAMVDELEGQLYTDDALAVREIIQRYTLDTDLAEKHRRVTDALRRIRDEINTLLGE